MVWYEIVIEFLFFNVFDVEFIFFFESVKIDSFGLEKVNYS